MIADRNRGGLPETLPPGFVFERWTEGTGRPAGRALVMDDDGLVRETLGRQLGALGCEVVAVGDGRSALLVYEGARRSGQPFDLVFLDLLVAGGWGGEETLRELRRLDPGVRAVICSGSLERTTEEYLRLGCRAVLGKPFTMAQLRAVLEIVGAPDGDGGQP